MCHPITWLPLPNIGNPFDFDHFGFVSDYLGCHVVQPGGGELHDDGDGALDVGADDDVFADADDGDDDEDGDDDNDRDYHDNENSLGCINDQS